MFLNVWTPCHNLYLWKLRQVMELFQLGLTSLLFLLVLGLGPYGGSASPYPPDSCLLPFRPLLIPRHLWHRPWWCHRRSRTKARLYKCWYMTWKPVYLFPWFENSSNHFTYDGRSGYVDTTPSPPNHREVSLSVFGFFSIQYQWVSHDFFRIAPLGWKEKAANLPSSWATVSTVEPAEDSRTPPFEE